MRLIVIEDEALVAMEIKSILSSAGHDVVGIADTLESAMTLAADCRPSLALVDVQLAAGESGLDVAAALKAAGTPSLFVTGNCPAMAGASAAIGCLHKPFSDRSLAGAVDVAASVLAGATPADLPAALHLY